MIRLFKPPQHAAGVPAVNNVYACVAFCLASSFANSFTSIFASSFVNSFANGFTSKLCKPFGTRNEDRICIWTTFQTFCNSCSCNSIGKNRSHVLLSPSVDNANANCYCKLSLHLFLLFCMLFYLQCKRKCKPFLLEVQMQTNLHLHSQHWYCVPCTPELDTAILYE